MENHQELPFEDISKTPTELTATNTILRMVEGLAFRYRWATENLSEENIKFRPHPTSMSIEEVNSHIFDLVDSTFRVFGGEKQIVRVTSVVPYLYCPPESHKKISFLLILFVFFFVAL